MIPTSTQSGGHYCFVHEPATACRAILRRREELDPGAGVGKARWAREIHIVLDNLSAHKTKAVREFRQQHPKVRFHVTPTYSSWLNQVELWFAKIQRDVIARGAFTTVADLARKLRNYIRKYGQSAKPFRWTYSDINRRIGTYEIAETAY
jgi:transposase